MLPQPLHPAIVHFPIVFVVILPVAALVAVWAIRRGADPRSSWWPVVALAGALVAASYVAVQTGSREEETVEGVVAESAIEQHEESAELFLSLTVVGLLLVSSGLLAGRAGRIGRGAAVVTALALVVAGYRVGHSGGELVYRHGAATAYSSSGLAPSGAGYDDGDEGRESARAERPESGG